MSISSICLADAQPLIIKGIEQLLKEHFPKAKIQSCSNETELKSLVAVHAPEYIVLDYYQPGHFHLDTIRWIKHYSPNSKLILLSSDQDPKRILQCVTLKPLGYITKECSSNDIVKAIKMASVGEKHFCGRILDIILSEKFDSSIPQTEPLTGRETEILSHIALGKTNKIIGEELHLSHHTIHSHRKKIMKKIRVNSAQELTRYAIEQGLV